MGTVRDGHLVRIYIGGVAVAKETSASIKFSGETKEISHKDISGNWSDADIAKLSCEISGQGLDGSDATGVDQLWTAFVNKTPVTMRWSDNVAGNKYWEGSFLITSLESNAPDNESTDYSFSATNKGEITRGTVS